ncbi:MAG: hypothetical protein ACI9TV_002629 [Sulfurimonas sp.]|jgi:hypothetical protein
MRGNKKDITIVCMYKFSKNKKCEIKKAKNKELHCTAKYFMTLLICNLCPKTKSDWKVYEKIKAIINAIVLAIKTLCSM